MADEETQKPKRSMKPKQGVIDLEATEIEREAALETPPPETPPVDELPPRSDEPLGDAPLSEAEPRSQLGTLIGAGVAGAAIAISSFVLLLALGLIPVGSSGDPALGNRVAELESRLAAAQNARPPAFDDSALRNEIGTLRQDIEKLSAAPTPAPDAALTARVAELAARIDQLSPADTASIDQLKTRLDEVAAQASAAREPDPAAAEALQRSKSASVLAAFAFVESAVARGAPYKDALTNLKRQLPDKDFGALEAGAEKGLPAASILARQYERDLETAAPPDTQATGLADRLAEGARSLVRIRPAAGSPHADKIDPQDPWSARNVIITRLRTGDYAGALADRSQLDAVAQKATEESATRLSARLDADKALDGLRADISARAEVQP